MCDRQLGEIQITYQDFTLYSDCTIFVTSQILMAFYFWKPCKFLNSIALEIIFYGQKYYLFNLTGCHVTVI